MNPAESITSAALPRAQAILGCLLGTAMGDGIGLPFEGLSPRRRLRLFGPVSGFRLVAGFGMGSDDTEHTVHVARALISADGDPRRFQRALAASFRVWFLCLPPGIGKATAMGCIKLLLGFPAERSGIFSGGNGPAMRSALLGVCFADDPVRMRQMVRASTRLTHTDPLAEEGAWLVAVAAGASGGVHDVVRAARAGADLDARWEKVLDKVESSLEAGEDTSAFAASLGQARGVSGFILHTVPVALHAALSAATVREAILRAVECGGDADTTGAIAGAIAGARLGPSSIPPEWLDSWRDFPITIDYLRALGDSLASATSGTSVPPPAFRWWAVLPRNLVFLLIVLVHLARRILPPW